MRVSPLDIRKQEFTRAFRGYEVEEVQAFLQMLSTEWEEMRDEHRRLEEQLRSIEGKIRHYERVEEALQEALQTARDSSRKTVENAEERARNIIKSAESKAAEIQGEALTQRDRLRQENSRLLNRQHELVARLRAFLTSEMEMLERYEGNQIVGARSAEVEREVPMDELPEEPDRARPMEEQNRWQDRETRQEREEAEPEDRPAMDEPTIQRRGTFNVRALVDRVDDDVDWAETLQEEGDSLRDLGVLTPDVEAADEVPDEHDRAREQDNTKARQATEEIEKIRRILNDLD